jgi:hypothetical protein
MIETAMFTDAESAEDLIPTLAYADLLQRLGPLTALGVLREGSPSAMLVVARIIDRGRIARSGLTRNQLRAALEQYRKGPEWRPVTAVESALEQAMETAARGSAARAGSEAA